MESKRAKDFFEQFLADEEQAARIREMEPDAVEAFAREHGFDVTALELEAAVKELRQTGSADVAELTIDEMDKAAGGAFLPAMTGRTVMRWDV